MDELIKSIKKTNLLLEEINGNLKIRYNKDKFYRITETEEGEPTVKQFTESDDVISYLNKKYNTNIKTNSLKNLTKLQTVKTNSKYKKIFGEDFKFEIV